MDTMMALRAHSRGGPEQLRLEQAPVPAPRTGEVLVAVHAAGITFDELTWDQSWTTTSGADRTPVIPAHEVSGTVAQLGGGVSDFAIGDEVFGLIDFNRDGAAADYTSVPAAALAPKPATISHPEAAALSLAGLTAWQALVDYADLALGEDVLVQGGAGAVGTYAVQLAAIRGGQVAATDSGRHVDYVRSLGAQSVIAPGADSLTGAMAPFDVVIDTVGGDALAAAYSVLRKGGRLVTLSGPPAQQVAAEHGAHAMFFVVAPDAAELAHLGDLLAGGELRSAISQTYPLNEGRGAYESAGRNRPPGKTILKVR
jgi:NADPH:quinone reductase-like Zn-dependent oxidoreductase